MISCSWILGDRSVVVKPGPDFAEAFIQFRGGRIIGVLRDRVVILRREGLMKDGVSELAAEQPAAIAGRGGIVSDKVNPAAPLDFDIEPGFQDGPKGFWNSIGHALQYIFGSWGLGFSRAGRPEGPQSGILTPSSRHGQQSRRDATGLLE